MTKVERKRLLSGAGSQPDGGGGAVAAGLYGHHAVNGRGQYEAVVVVGMLADDIDAAGGIRSYCICGRSWLLCHIALCCC